MSEPNPPTHEELLEMFYANGAVDSGVDDTWRWGTENWSVFHRESDDTHWRVKYRVGSGDCEVHGIRDNDYFMVRVYKVKKVIETWDVVPE